MSEKVTAAEKISLTIRETELAVIALQSLKHGKVDLDEAKFAQMAGYSNAKSANVCFANLKKKLNTATLEAHYVAAGTGAPTPKKPRAKPSAKSQVNETSTPSKRKSHPTEDTTPTKRSKDEKYVKKEEDAEEALDEDEA
ncbi:MAG: hypothetical protein Q9209_001434 [Squamulea sp. 1 TL-2023]